MGSHSNSCRRLLGQQSTQRLKPRLTQMLTQQSSTGITMAPHTPTAHTDMDTDTMAPGISTRERLRLRLNLRPRLIPSTTTMDSTATDTLPMVPTHTLMEPTAP